MIDMERVRPVNGFVILRFPPIPDHVKLPSGLFAPHDTLDPVKWRAAQVVAVDPRGFRSRDRTFVPHVVNVGDWVVIEAIFGDRVVEGSVVRSGYRVVSEDQITAVIEGDDVGDDYIFPM